MPRIGLLSDSHGRAEITRHAVELLLSHRVELLLHMGDIGSVEVIDAMAATPPGSDEPIEARVVFGNCDMDVQALTRYAQDVGVQVDGLLGQVPLEDDGLLVFCHGHKPQMLERALARGARYFCQGHTHQRMDVRRGVTRLINPGALHRAAEHTVAVLDTEADALEFHVLPQR